MYQEQIAELGKRVRSAFLTIRNAETNLKNEAISRIAEGLEKKRHEVLLANDTDVKKARVAGVRESLIDRLVLTHSRIDEMVNTCRKIVALPDPIGQEIGSWLRPDGLMIRKVRVAIGALGIIYESRPNVTIDAAVLALKASNTVLLKGGSDAFETNTVLAEVMQDALSHSGLPQDAILLIPFREREAIEPMLHLREHLALLIPRGGAQLIEYVRKNATLPVLETGVGNCHIFVDRTARIPEAVAIIVNAKVQKPAACNAVEKVLIHQEIAQQLLPILKTALEERKVRLRGCARTKALIDVELATVEDWQTEYLDLILGIRVVTDIEEAIEHITRYSSGHSEAIITNTLENATRFEKEIDAAVVYVNASTRFTDGGEFGFGAEMGISTQRLHARGPVGLEELTTWKYVIHGNYHVRKG